MQLKLSEKIFIYSMIVIGVAIYQLLRLIPQPGFMLKELEEVPEREESRKERLCYSC
ncbi:hypothetical protein [Nitratifractor salsuginis]|uniref:Uncharacterized protein n=1 Tax=Nitratifractor salsuginis (strain DSM 16511 / JCM 12458 / E9I37-1) TaxID=749222 RepID=E6X269_NITSE|nr:hypothetical protein [Nitratifractor salsuginis]ADV47138.1 hypothetical protein Nitsa_1894 [Nitratifractor salsuginis DSM 16511]